VLKVWCRHKVSESQQQTTSTHTLLRGRLAEPAGPRLRVNGSDA
jgi:hypothetical protein